MAEKGPQGASLTKTLLRTFRTRIVTTTTLLLVSNFLGLLGPVSSSVPLWRFEEPMPATDVVLCNL